MTSPEQCTSLMPFGENPDSLVLESVSKLQLPEVLVDKSC